MTRIDLPAYSPAEVDRLCAEQRDISAQNILTATKLLSTDLRAGARTDVRRLFEATDNLRRLDRTPDALMDLARVLPASTVSRDNLAVQVSRSSFPGVPDWADRTTRQRELAVLADSMGVDEFPWLAHRRAPRPREVRAAIEMIAREASAQRVETAVRGQVSRRQETLLRALSETAGFTCEAVPTPLTALSDQPLGTYSPGERKVAIPGKRNKADHVVGFGTVEVPELVLVEAKFSSTPVNSIKRLAEAENKFRIWSAHFGVAAHNILFFGGAVTPENVLELQATGGRVVFEHATDEYAAWLSGCR